MQMEVLSAALQKYFEDITDKYPNMELFQATIW
jgi:hypothetical protein